MTTLASGRAVLRDRRISFEPWAVPAVFAALLCAYYFETRLMLIELVAALLLMLPLVVSPRIRLVYIVVGTVTVFGPSQLTPSKLLFLFGATVALGGALWHCRELVRTPAYSDLVPVFRGSIAVGLMVLLSWPVAHYNAVPDKEWLRDVAPYVLMSWAPIFALDAQSAFTVRALRRLMALVGVAGALIFTKYWYQGHQISNIVTGDAGLATLLLSGALFSFAIAIVLNGERGQLAWLGLASVMFAMMATTGARSSAVLLAAPLAIAFGSRRRMARRSLRLLVALPIAAILVVLSAQSLLKLVHADSEQVTERVNLLFQAGGTADDSYINRVNETHSAVSIFKKEPIFGAGPGSPIPWTDSRGGEHAKPTIDPQVGFLVDYGLVGVAVMVFYAVSYVGVLRRLYRRTGERTTAQLALIGFAAVVLSFSILQTPFEDKGFATGLLLLLAVAAREAANRSKPAAVRPAPP